MGYGIRKHTHTCFFALLFFAARRAPPAVAAAPPALAADPPFPPPSSSFAERSLRLGAMMRGVLCVEAESAVLQLASDQSQNEGEP